MDVTSLLNANNGAAEQRYQEVGGREDASRTPTKSRTPWDAGGYSLPIHSISYSVPTTPPHNTLPEDIVRNFTPPSPRHKFSDSRSSLSSFASSLHSTTHSRFSSMSTVGSSQPLSSFSEVPCEGYFPLSPEPRSQSLELHAVPDLMRASVSRSLSHGSQSPTDSLAALSLSTAEALQRRQSETLAPFNVRGESPLSAKTERESGSATPPEERSGSPSDAILIRRPTLPSLWVITSEQESRERQQIIPSENYLCAPSEQIYHSRPHVSGHKRALSAPAFPMAPINYGITVMGAANELTPPSSAHVEHTSPTNVTRSAIVNSPPTEATKVDGSIDGSIKCMYVEDCATGSQLRKAISHIFGRNKMCTRLIPSHVWVHYCRKHYQRVRYRNPKAYAITQCKLVKQQVGRVENWSMENAAEGGSGCVVQDWSLSVRKRELKRLENIATGQKRRATTMDEEYDSEGYEQMGPGSTPPSAVSQWLIEKCGSGYSTGEITEILDRLEADINEGGPTTQFPDIELLPNIVGHVAEPKAPKERRHQASFSRNGARGSHKRTQSLGVVGTTTYSTLHRQVSESPMTGSRLAQLPQFMPKRRRVVDAADEHDVGPHAITEHDFHRRNSIQSRLPEMGLRSQGTHRPMSYIPEHPVGDYDNYTCAPHQSQSHLAAPAPQRYNNFTASRLEQESGYPHHPASSYSETGNGYPHQGSAGPRLQIGNGCYQGPSAYRPSHARSHSDVSSIPHRNMIDETRVESSMSQSSRTGMNMQAMSDDERPPQFWNGFPAQSHLEPGPYPGRMQAPDSRPNHVNRPSLHGPGHQRTLSTPVVYSSHIAFSSRESDAAASGGNPWGQYPRLSHISEDVQTRASYTASR